MSDLFHARTTDPETSHLAATNLNHFDMTPVEKLIWTILNGSQMTDEQLVERYLEVSRTTNPKLVRSPQAIRTVRKYMYDKSLVRVVGLGVTRSGNKARIWTALEL